MKPSNAKLKEVMTYLSTLGAKKGGDARAAALTQEQRSDIARKAGLASGLARRKKP